MAFDENIKKRNLLVLFKFNGELNVLVPAIKIRKELNSAHLLIIHTLTCRCLRICSSPCLLQSALDDLKRHLSHNGYPRGIISYNMNDVVNKHQNKPKDIITVPKKKFSLFYPIWVFKVKLSLNS